MSCLKSSLSKSCHHTVQDSFTSQVARLQEAGFPDVLLKAVAEKLLETFGRFTASPRADTTLGTERRGFVVLPYVHKLSHGIKKVARKFGVDVFCSAPCKLSRVCALTSVQRSGSCGTNHKRKFVGCRSEVVYEVPLSCGKVYVGQTGRCLNKRLSEHSYAVASASGQHLAVHCRSCANCIPLFEETKVLGRAREKRAREILEASVISRLGPDKCISEPSVYLHKKELAFLA